jgi:hypothetical protein
MCIFITIQSDDEGNNKTNIQYRGGGGRERNIHSLTLAPPLEKVIVEQVPDKFELIFNRYTAGTLDIY